MWQTKGYADSSRRVKMRSPKKNYTFSKTIKQQTKLVKVLSGLCLGIEFRWD